MRFATRFKLQFRSGEDEPPLLERTLSVNYAVLPHKGEDSFALWSDARGDMLCVADGCGGLGGRRYDQLGDQTGAYVASRLMTRAFAGWADERTRIPDTPEQGRVFCQELEGDFSTLLQGFAKKNCRIDEPTRIVGSMQRILPTTLCACIAEQNAGRKDCCFLWAGDSRGYTLDGDGLHQCTRDDLRGNSDPFESLYRDAPLSNLLSADQPIHLNMRRLTLNAPSILLCVTDGVFDCLSTPMEFEMLLLSTLLAANSLEGWQRKLQLALTKLAHDDATLLCLLCGFESYAQLKQHFILRQEALKCKFILPVRRDRNKLEVARDKWMEYKQTYDRTEGVQHEPRDWRI